MYVPPDHYLWDFWLLDHQGLYHLFYLRAPRDVAPAERHYVARVGHATSPDLRTWEEQGIVLEPGPAGSWDDTAIWTGSVLEHGGRFYMLYTAIQVEGGKVLQQIGLAASDDLYSWEKHPANPVLRADPTWYEMEEDSSLNERAWRDPYLVYRHDESRFYAAITAREKGGAQQGRACVGLASSQNLLEWTVHKPLFAPGEFGQMEVPQWIELEGRSYLIFNLYAPYHARSRRTRLQHQPDALMSGSYLAIADDPFGPFRLADERPLVGGPDRERYGSKLLRDPAGRLTLLHWLGTDEAGHFVGGLSDPIPVSVNPDGRLLLHADGASTSGQTHPHRAQSHPRHGHQTNTEERRMAAGETAQRQPNILFIMTDDHAAQAIGAYGSRINDTPHLDRLAREGMRFDHCYVSNSICTPSRAAILTGTHNHVNRVTTLDTHFDNRLPHVAKHLQAGGYQTAIIGKWHLGQGPRHWPTGFDFWSVLPGQGIYHNPVFYEMGERRVEPGYVTDVITDKCIDWLDARDPQQPFFLMCHHKAPHRPWDPKPEHRALYTHEIPEPETFNDDYKNRARAAAAARMRVAEDMTYDDLDLVELPESPGEVHAGSGHKIIPHPQDPSGMELRCRNTGELFTFRTQQEFKEFKYQRYLRKYLQCVHSIDENVGRLLDYLDRAGLSDDTVVVYTSDQGFYLGEHGWFDKRFIYEESFRMPFLVRYPRMVEPGSTCDQMVSNVDFAQTFLDLAGVPEPNYMQGRSIRPLLEGQVPEDWTEVAYHRYWMNQDDIHNAYAHYGIRTHRYKLIYWYNEDCDEPGANPGTDDPEWELFDLQEDPLELFNLYDDPRYAEIVTDMRRRLDREMARIGDTPMHDVVDRTIR